MYNPASAKSQAGIPGDYSRRAGLHNVGMGGAGHRMGPPGGRPSPVPSQNSGAPRIDSNNEVVQFLKEIGLQMYSTILLQNGFDEMETLLAIEEGDLRGMGVPTYHIVRLRKHLQDVRRQMGQDDTNPNHPVVAFLTNIGLGQYAGVLIRSGFDDMETLGLVEDADLKDMGLPRGHAVKLRRRLHEHELSSASRDERVYYSTKTDARASPPAGPPTTQKNTWERPLPTPALQMPPSMAQSYAQSVHEEHPVPEQMKTAVEQSWESVQALGSAFVGEMLYRNTFQLDPSAMDLFPLHVRQKYKEWTADETPEEELDIFESAALKKLFSKFINAIGCTVAGLNDMSKLVPLLTKLGARHVQYGVGEERWETLGKALQMTLQNILKEDFTHEVQTAWVTVYNFMASIMIQGLRQAKDASISVRGLSGNMSAASTGVDGEEENSQCSSAMHQRALEEAQQRQAEEEHQRLSGR
mmetsp:Transcript_16101/g.34800  ORF Transcript_16101/g.34800 Transcript_16101/m.34800 type:complete len:469 (+) Transcript_16101:89-1495(+)